MTPADLLKVDTSGHIEKKNGLSYLSWAWAWTEALKVDPTATFSVDTFSYNDQTVPFMKIGDTAMVWVNVTMFGQKRTCMLPVMDFKNQPITEPDSVQVNKAIMRCLVKCIALHGLGLNIYAGEDLPESVDQETGEIKRRVEPKPQPKPELKVEAKLTKPPAKVEGKDGKWKIKVETTPEANATDFINIVSEAAVLALESAQSQGDVMDIFRVNREVFDKVKALDESCFKDLLDAFKARKEKFA